jgi:hypothetical protein
MAGSSGIFDGASDNPSNVRSIVDSERLLLNLEMDRSAVCDLVAVVSLRQKTCDAR